ncbi:hypothetical protein BGZ65_011132, partial [Modicella reniformis]
MQRYEHQIHPTETSLNTKALPDLPDTKDGDDTTSLPLSSSNKELTAHTNDFPPLNLTKPATSSTSLSASSPPPSSTTPPQQASITDVVITSAATAASTAISTASNVVAAARRLVVPQDGEDNDNVNDDSDNTGMNLVNNGNESDHCGLQFSQRHMSKAILDHGASSNGVSSDVTGSSTDVDVRNDNINSNTKKAGDTLGDIASTSATTVPDHVGLTSDMGVASDKNISLGQKDLQDTNAIPITNDPDDSEVKMKSSPPLNVLYVAAHGEGSARHHAMGVDTPAVSKTMPFSKAKHSCLGVDTHRLV